MKPSCTPAKERRITRWEHEHVVEAMQTGWTPPQRHAQPARDRHIVRDDQRLDASNPLPDEAADVRCDRDGLHVLAYNLTRVMNIVVRRSLIAAIRA